MRHIIQWRGEAGGKAIRDPEDNPAAVRLIREMLDVATDVQFHVVWSDCLSAAVDRLSGDGTDMILLDLQLPKKHCRRVLTDIRQDGQLNVFWSLILWEKRPRKPP